MRTIIVYLFTMMFALAFPVTSYAATFEVSGWIPYWRSATGTADVSQHLNLITEVNPFNYTLKKDGSLVDNGKLDSDIWTKFFQEAKAKKIRIVPSVMNSDPDTIHALLSKSSTRQKLEDDIVAEVLSRGYNGIDIDFENKYAKTKPYFSLFLKGLQMRLGNKKWLMCTIEARTPPDKLYKKAPKTIERANDFVAINKYCDRVRFMTYDQMDAVYSLNEKNKNVLYAPISDPAWVEMAIKYAIKTGISKNKIIVGIPTYGYEYRVSGSLGDYSYKILWSFNHRYALQQSANYRVLPLRNIAGEMGIKFVPTSTAQLSADMEKAQVVPQDWGGDESSRNDTLNPKPELFRYLVWNDAVSMKQKVDLAKRLGARGVAFFKWDGGEDPEMWNMLKGVKK